MNLFIGTKNKAKLNGCLTAMEKLTKKYPAKIVLPDIKVQSLGAPSGVADMPLSLNEIQKGALNRAFFAYNHADIDAHDENYAIGMEGGVYLLEPFSDSAPVALLQSWVYIYNGKEGHFGCSAGLELPRNIQTILFNTDRELAEVIDEISGQEDVRSHGGAFGILTRDIFTRQMAFEEAIINGFAPFLNDTYYGEENGN